MKVIKNQSLTILFVIISFFSCKKNGNDDPPVQEPVQISGLIPAQNIVGSDFIINGSGFDPIATNNIVKIGNITLTVKKATSTSLLVNCPTTWISDKVSVTKGSLTFTTSFNYSITDNFYKNLRLKSYLLGKSDLLEFSYNTANQLTIKKILFINPINGLTFSVGQSEYFYDTVGELIKEVNIPAGSNTQTITEYYYTDGSLTSDKVYTFNTTNSSIVNLSTHTYLIVGRQLLQKVTKDVAGVEVSSESYAYSIVDGVPQVVRTINSSANGTSTETYIQHLLYVEPYALLIPNSLQPTLFLASSATFSNPSIKNYTITLPNPTVAVMNNIRYQYAGGLANNAVYTYENK